MAAKGKAEKAAEVEVFTKYSAFCKTTATEKKHEIMTAGQELLSLGAEIAKQTDVADVAGRAVAELDATITSVEAEISKAQKLRAAEKRDFQAVVTDYEESLFAVTQAISVLRKQDYKRAQVLLMQISALPQVPASARKALLNYFKDKVAKPSTSLVENAPEVAAYDPHVGSVIEMLSELNEKLGKQKLQAEREEMNKAHAHQMMLQDLSSELAYAKDTHQRKLVTQTKASEAAAAARAGFAATSTSKAEDERYKADLEAQCRVKAQEFEARQKLRAEELEALAKATEVIKSSALSGNAAKHLPAMLQKRVLTQLRARRAPSRDKLLGFLQGAASRSGSRMLALAAASAAVDPFIKVKKLLQELIDRLNEEAQAEAEQHGFCQKELHDNKLQRDAKRTAVDQLTSEVDKYAASIAKLAAEIADLSETIQASDESVKEATATRAEEKARNEETIRDSKEAQAATSRAVQILKEFYGKAALVQAAPETWSTPYKGMQEAKGGVVGMLEVIQSDFARLEAETAADEHSSATAHATFLDEAKVDREVKYQTRLGKQRRKTQDEFEKGRKDKDLAATRKELTLALDYYEKLKAQCVATGLSHEDRVRMREEEIEALKQALEILE